MKRLFVLLLVGASHLWSQIDEGEMRVRIADPAGVATGATIEISSSSNGYHKTFTSGGTGMVFIKQLPYGVYLLQARQPGFAAFSKVVEVRSALPLDEFILLDLAREVTRINVTENSALVDPYRPSSVMQIGSAEIQQRLSSLPGRFIQDLVNSQPGWLYEGNAVLHPRGSEYQTQIVIDGIPLTDNRSPGLGPEIEADDLNSVSVYTAGYPAEYGRKMGGVVELSTRRQTDPGLHGEFVFSGGSYDTGSGHGQLQETTGRNAIFGSASGSMSSHYLNPVVPENYTNTGTVGDFSARCEREITDSNRLSFELRREFSRYLIPNELLQEQAGQVQNGDNVETMGSVRYQHIVSPNTLVWLAGMVRDNASDLHSNLKSTPIIAVQHNDFQEGYFKGTFSHHEHHQELKVGIESDAIFLHEKFSYSITDPTQFNENTALKLSFTAQRPDLEQSGFIDDMVRLNKWTLSAGLRWDHYQLLLNRNSVSPRISIGRYLPSLNMVLHASFDRIFQTPSFENILITSSPQVEALSNQFLRLPVQPSVGSYYEVGLVESLFGRMRLDINIYRRKVNNYADDDQLLNTGVSYPIAFDKAVIYGAEGKLEVMQSKRLSGFVSYSYMVGNAWSPVTGGLFLGEDAGKALTQLSGHFPDSQDQRNTLRTRFEYHLIPRVWFAAGAVYGSGLPFDYGGTEAEALADYGPEVISRINFARGRIRPLLSVNSSAGIDIYKSEKVSTRLQIDGDNLNNRLNVLDFGGLFSGNAIAPARSFNARLTANF